MAEASKAPSASGVGSEALKMLLWPSAAWKSRTSIASTVRRDGLYRMDVNQPRRSVTSVMTTSTLICWPDVVGRQDWIAPREVAVLPAGSASMPKVVTISGVPGQIWSTPIWPSKTEPSKIVSPLLSPTGALLWSIKDGKMSVNGERPGPTALTVKRAQTPEPQSSFSGAE